MNPTVSTIRPALSTVIISASQYGNSRQLDELVDISQETQSSYSMEEPSPYWASGRDVLGLDDSNHVMYGLTRKESWLFSAGVIAGLTALSYVCKWLLML